MNIPPHAQAAPLSQAAVPDDPTPSGNVADLSFQASATAITRASDTQRAPASAVPRLIAFAIDPAIKQIVEDETPYKEEIIRLFSFSEEAREAYPTRLARGTFDNFVTVTNDIALRFPSFNAGHLQAGGEPLGRDGRRLRIPEHEIAAAAFREDVIHAYDGNPAYVRARHAGYVISPRTMTAWYQVGDKPVQSICDRLPVYPLRDGKWMFSQPWVNSSPNACVEMLLAEGKDRQAVTEQISGLKSRMAARLFNLVETLEKRSGRRVITVHGQHRLSSHDVTALRALLEKHGACIFNQGMYVSMLDDIQETPEGNIILSRRIPSSGSYFDCADHASIWTGCIGEDDGHVPDFCRDVWDAHFLTREAAPASAPAATAP
ncbi:hypothetical protein [Bordetella sp. N]|uniref:hypothetical protein n=1 Tax=Bordetella sp. N TaxID=1746199 RepID=UPI00070C07A8|nr:hypothetical protein [Bordetella sp. N]ALM81798.1 hypothetical protein ASB57_01410 [Bordetella sp. N]